MLDGGGSCEREGEGEGVRACERVRVGARGEGREGV